MSIYIPKELEDAVVSYTDAGEWKCSWHWDRDRSKAWGPITRKGAEEMVRDLQCEGSLDMELAAMERKIRSRYALAATIRRLIDEERVREIADSHEEGCDCQFCIAAGYVQTLGEKGQRP
jgi:hypothetical protein